MRLLVVLLMACGQAHFEETPDNPPEVIVEKPDIEVCSEQTVSVPLTADTFLFEQYKDIPQGGRTEVFYTDQAGSRSYPMVKWEEFPVGEIREGRLLFSTIYGNVHLTAFTVGAPWDEGTTWQDMEDSPLLWAEPDSIDTVTVSGRSSLPLPPDWLEDWRSGAHANNGIMLRTWDINTGFNAFPSRESLDPPVVEIDYIHCEIVPAT